MSSVTADDDTSSPMTHLDVRPNKRGHFATRKLIDPWDEISLILEALHFDHSCIPNRPGEFKQKWDLHRECPTYRLVDKAEENDDNTRRTLKENFKQLDVVRGMATKKANLLSNIARDFKTGREITGATALLECARRSFRLFDSDPCALPQFTRPPERGNPVGRPVPRRVQNLFQHRRTHVRGSERSVG
ncbi:hypothetical protein K491DRAFT_744287 [Lophiostoma macrostomum CBS 122681]|uniref:Uncharacterized protein n=1 Tax=Lophiostoma macrostomum CBS 122681 TaxID=1314788 RepID=A0A6A6TD62_9PLEO|nr:hypothetical protein K491DRAFT_744287 [Lophiostoma macrostomum CBS 122681]